MFTTCFCWTARNFCCFQNRKELCLQCPCLTFNYKPTHLNPLNCVLIPFWFEKWEIIPIFGINRWECLWGWVIFCHAAWETVLAMKKNFLRPSIVEPLALGKGWDRCRSRNNVLTHDAILSVRGVFWGNAVWRLRVPAENARIQLYYPGQVT